MPTETLNLFTYGSLMYPQVWQRVVRGSYTSSEAKIHGFRRLRLRDELYPVLVVAKGAPPLLGRIYYQVSATDVKRLDDFETNAYVRVTISATVNGIAIPAHGYAGRHSAEVINQDWDPANFEQFGMRRFLDTYTHLQAPKDRA